jgi:hypothetical protein
MLKTQNDPQNPSRSVHACYECVASSLCSGQGVLPPLQKDSLEPPPTKRKLGGE